MEYKVWNIPEGPAIPEELIRAGYAPLLAAVLGMRGITTRAQAEEFLTEGPACLEDPWQMADMDAAVARIRRAVEKGETVAVYGDYDVDGITAACLLTEFFTGMGLKTVTYIPDRLEEGYGVNAGAIYKLREKGVKLIVTVDCGITAVKEAEVARALFIDMIITDHHECQSTLPRAVAVVDPKRPDSLYPNRDLAGVGVAFKLACALAGEAQDALWDKYVDLVAVGTVADVMPLTGENRRMVKAGLEKLGASARPGLAALLAEAGAADGRIGASTVGFTLAPRINAAGRLGKAELSVALLLEQDPVRAKALAAELCAMNRQRQQMEAGIWDDAMKMLDGQTPTAPIVLARQNWHQGVIGIVASRLTEVYQVPAIMISLKGARGKGSCRSWGDYNLFDALAACEDALESFGGHALAAGLNIHFRDIDRFRELLAEHYRQNLPHEPEGLTVDMALTERSQLSMKNVESLEALEPYGAGNPRPVMYVSNATVASVNAMGGGKHTRLRLEMFGQGYDCVWFGQNAGELKLSRGERVDAAFYPQINEFRGRRSVQLLMTDLRKADVSDRCLGILEGGPVDNVAMSREELGRLWRALTGLCPRRMAVALLGNIEPRLRPEKIALGLRVLRELELAEVTLEDGEIAIGLRAWEVKADLNDSPAWRARKQ